MRSFFHRPIPFLPLFSSCQFWRLDSIQFLCSQAHIPADWRLETRLFTRRLLLKWTLPYNNFTRTTQKTQSLYCWEGVFIEPLHSNGSYSIVAYVFVAVVICLSGRCLAVNVYSDFAISAFGRHVTIYKCILHFCNFNGCLDYRMFWSVLLSLIFTMLSITGLYDVK
jgi:hypothetical protein